MAAILWQNPLNGLWYWKHTHPVLYAHGLGLIHIFPALPQDVLLSFVPDLLTRLHSENQQDDQSDGHQEPKHDGDGLVKEQEKQISVHQVIFHLVSMDGERLVAIIK